MSTDSAYFVVVERPEKGGLLVCCWNQFVIFSGVYGFVLGRVSLFLFDCV